MSCLTEKDLSNYDYVSVRKVGFVPISIKPTTSATRLTRDLDYMNSKEERIRWLRRRANEHRSSRNDAKEVVDDFDEVGKLGSGFMSMDAHE
jgi:hypothetical protein